MAAFRDLLQDARKTLEDRFRAGVPASALVRQRARFVDEVVNAAWRRVGLDTHPELALVAVGGYGRSELHPGSDIDLLVLLPRSGGAELADGLRALVAFLWDVGLEVGHSARSVEDCVREAAREVTVATALMEARLLAGSEPLFASMREATGPDRVWPSREFYLAKREEQTRRHQRFGDTAYRLEPNVKEGPGGLRDIQMVGWVAKRHFGALTLHDLVTHGFLTGPEHRALVCGEKFLWQVRFALHVITGRREDRLLFDHQRTLAKEFGYDDDDANLAVEKFMKRYYRTIMELSRLNEMLLELFEEAILLADQPRQVTAINPRFQAVNGYLEVTGDQVFRDCPFALLELFLVMQRNPELKGVRASTIRLVRDHRRLIDQRFREDPRAPSLFLEILRQPRRITRELRRMNRYGVLAQYLPAFGSVVGQMQYDLFHAYTVDEHSLFVVSNLRAFATPEKAGQHPLCAAIFPRLPKPELLYVAGLYHDIAKGRGGDHSELGAELAGEFCRDHRLDPLDSRQVSWLVRHHLLMSITAQRRDITDPEVVNDFAARVGDRVRLDYLYLLTVADIRGTNPSLWNDWKDTLLRDLYHATRRALRRGLEHPFEARELVEETQRGALVLLDREGVDADHARRLWDHFGEDYFLRHTADELAWHALGILGAAEPPPLVLVRPGRGGTEVFCYAPDQKNLFAASTTVFGRLGLNIVDARIITAENGMTLDSYVVLDLDGEAIAAPGRRAEVAEALRAALADPAATRHRAETRRLRRELRHFRTRTEVSFLPDPRNDRTVIEVVARDRPGLLSRIGWALSECDVRLQNAKIATYGERAEDVFFVTDARNRPLPAERWEEVRAAVVTAVDAD